MTDFETTHAQLKAQYDELRTQYEALNNMRDDLIQIFGTNYVVTAARNLHGISEKRYDEITKLNKENRRLFNEAEQARSSVMPLAAEVNKLEAQITAAKVERDKIIDEHRVEKSKLRAENRQLRDTYAPTFATEFEELKGELLEKNKLVDEYARRLRHVESKHYDTIKGTDKTISELRSKLQSFEQDCQIRDEKIADLTSALGERNTKIAAFTGAISTNGAQIMELRTQNEEDGRCIKELRAQLDDAHKAQNVWCENLRNANKELEVLRPLLERYTATNEGLIKQARERNAKLEDLTTQLDEQSRTIRIRGEIIDDRDRHIDGLLIRLEQTDKHRSAEIEDVKKQNEELLTTLNDLELQHKQDVRTLDRYIELNAEPTTLDRIQFLRDWAIHQPDWSMENGVDRYRALMETVAP